MLTGFAKGLSAHARGVRFAFAHKRYLLLTAIPFALTLALFAAGIGVFAANDDRLLALVWSPQAAETTGALGALYWFYVHVAKLVLYALAFVLLYFLFMVVANILASPVYDVISERMVRQLRGEGAAGAGAASIWRVMLEEMKKAVFVVAVPLLLVLIPVVGQILAPVAAAFLLAFDFLDYAFARDEPRFTARLRAMARRPLMLLGFGLPLLVPLLNIVLFPCAICGATLLYLDAGAKDGARSRDK
jgi:CysZ protein